MKSEPVPRGSDAPPDGGLPPLRSLELPAGVVNFRDGAGPRGARAVVLLHGFLATSVLNWLHVFDPLARHFRVIAPDLCGHGSDPFDRRRFSLEGCADDVAGLVSALGLERPIVVGYSMGGMVAQLLGRRHAARVGGLVLSGVDWGSPRYGPVARTVYPLITEGAFRLVQLHACMLRAPLALLRGGEGAGAPRGPLRRAAGEMIGHDPRAIGGAVREITVFRSLDWLHEIRVPTTVLVTLRDNLFPEAEQRRMASGIPRSRVREFDGGHVSARLPAYATALVDACRELDGRLARGRRRR